MEEEREVTDLIFAKLKDDVNIVLVLKKGVELDNVLVIQGLVHVNFILKLMVEKEEEVRSG